MYVDFVCVHVGYICSIYKQYICNIYVCMYYIGYVCIYVGFIRMHVYMLCIYTILKFKIKSVAYSSQGSHAGQLDFRN